MRFIAQRIVCMKKCVISCLLILLHFCLALATNLALANFLFQWLTLLLTLLNAQMFLWHYLQLIVYFCIINNFEYLFFSSLQLYCFQLLLIYLIYLINTIFSIKLTWFFAKLWIQQN